MSIQTNQIIVVKGSDQPIEVQLISESECESSIFSLVNATEIRAIFKNQDSTSLIKTLTDSSIEIVSDVNGKILIKFEGAETSLLRSGDNESFEIEVTVSTDGGATSDIYIWQLIGALDIRERL